MLLALAVFLMTINACKTDPIVIEIVGGPVNIDTTGTINFVSITEENPCDNDVISFQDQVLPILVANCAYSGCHDAQSHREGIVLESYSQVRSRVRPGNPNNSKIYRSITENQGDDDFMPPPPASPLSASDINIIRNWILQGAEDTDCRMPCNSEETSFADNILPLIQNKCYGCHQPSNTQGDVNLSDYAHIRTFAVNGLLMGTIKHDQGYQPMPPSGNQLTECQRAQIQNWIIEGAQDN